MLALVVVFYASTLAALFFLAKAFFTLLDVDIFVQGRLRGSLWLSALLGTGCLFVFIVKGIFSRVHVSGAEVEIGPQDHPRLFALVRHVAERLGVPMPSRVLLTADANASAAVHGGFFSLFLPPKRELRIGLGFLGVLTVEELAAVLAHEFGHLGQKTLRFLQPAHRVHCILFNLSFRRDALDTAMARVWEGFAVTTGLSRYYFRVWLTVFTLADRALSRALEFGADRFSAELAGRKTAVSALDRTAVAGSSFQGALEWANEMGGSFRLPANLFATQRRLLAQAPAEALAKVVEAYRRAPASFYDTHPPNARRIDAIERMTDVPETVPLPSAGDSRGLLDRPDDAERTVTAAFYAATVENAARFRLVDDAAMESEAREQDKRRARYGEAYGREILGRLSEDLVDIAWFQREETPEKADRLRAWEALAEDLAGCLEKAPPLRAVVRERLSACSPSGRLAALQALAMRPEREDGEIFRVMAVSSAPARFCRTAAWGLAKLGDASGLAPFVQALRTAAKAENLRGIEASLGFVLGVVDYPPPDGTINAFQYTLGFVQWFEKHAAELLWSEEKQRLAAP